MLDLFKREPVIVINSAVGIVAAVIALLVAFGVALTEEQKAAIIGLVTIIGTALATVAARSQVTPVAMLPEDCEPQDTDALA